MGFFSYPKSSRLLKRSEYQKILDGGIKIVNPHVVLLGTRSEQVQSRVGLIVSKKIGPAALRNRIKRHLRESFRHIQGQVPGIDIVVIARNRARHAIAEEISSSFSKAFYSIADKLEVDIGKTNTEKLAHSHH